MKRITIFIDGTFNRTDSQNPKNVVCLSRCVKHFDRKTYTPQMVIYSPVLGLGAVIPRLGASSTAFLAAHLAGVCSILSRKLTAI